VRRRKEAIRSRVKGDLPIVFTDEKLSAYGGLELFRRFVNRSGFTERLKEAFSIRQFDGDYGSFRVTLALLDMLLLGGTRLRHLRVLERDPLFLRFARLHRLPTDRTVSNTLKETTGAIRDRLGDLLREVAYETVREAGLSRATIDLDGTVLRTGLFAEGAERGFNPHHPKDKSYYPLTAHLAQTGQILAVVSHREAREKFAGIYRQSRQTLASVLREGVARGELRELPVESAAAALTALVEGLLLQAVVDPQFDPRTHWPALWALARRGIEA
jgi:hypothetical protein